MQKDDEHLRTIAREAARDALEEFLTIMGLDVTDHDEMRRIQRDGIFLRDLREGSEAVKKKSVLSLIGVLVTGMTALIILGVKEYLLPPG